MSIDVPEAPTRPRPRSERRTRAQETIEREAEWANLLDDLTYMADTGEHTEGAARRVDKSPAALEAWLRARDRADLWQRLRDNAPYVGKALPWQTR